MIGTIGPTAKDKINHVINQYLGEIILSNTGEIPFLIYSAVSTKDKVPLDSEKLMPGENTILNKDEFIDREIILYNPDRVEYSFYTPETNH